MVERVTGDAGYFTYPTTGAVADDTADTPAPAEADGPADAGTTDGNEQ